MKQDDSLLKIALIQSPLYWEDPAKNRRMFSSKIEEVANDVDLIVLPEMFTTGFTMSPQNSDDEEGTITLNWMKEKASEKSSALVGSIVYKNADTYFNRLFFVKPDGQYYCYDKRHTFTLAGEHEKYQSGTERLIVDYKGFKLCPLICYDLRFPVWSRNTKNYDVLLYVANWPAPRINAWDTLLSARAIENMSYCIGLNRVGADKEGHKYPGHSAVYDPLGNKICYSEKEEILEVTLSKFAIDGVRKKFPFLKDMDNFKIM